MSPRPVVVFLIILLLSACSTQTLRQLELYSTYLNRAGELAECAKLFVDVDELVLAAGVSDAQAARVAGFPYLRTNRLLATFSHQLSTKMMPDWLGQMRQLDREARHYELQNVTNIAAEYGSKKNIEERLNVCADILIQADLQDPVQLENIKQVTKVPNSYIQGNRILGLYPVSRLFVSRGIGRLQEQIKATFSLTTDKLPVSGQLISYAPKQAPVLSKDHIAQLISASGNNELSIPVFGKQLKESLFNHFAPVWQLDVFDDNDIIGVPSWSAEGKIRVQTSVSKVYRHLSYVSFKGQILPQFNYVIWFPSRPATSTFDILSGNLDGITWRVTVTLDGEVLMYDVMHNCGCYHMFFPSPDAEIRIVENSDKEEPVLVPQRAPILQEGERIHIRIASGSHYIEAVRAATIRPEYKTYSFADYNELRSLSMKNGKRKSMFGVNGIVPGTRRKERWLLWPMGVEDAGAMRQWGHHATAFVGRRHFDDADLLERYFSFP